MKRVLTNFGFIPCLVCLACLLMSCKSEYNKLQEQVFSKAINEFNMRLYYKDMEESSRQSIVDALTEGKGFVIISDDALFNKTGHFNYPLTANRITEFKGPGTKPVLVSREQLFIYDNMLDRWLPLSEKTIFIKDGKLSRKIEEDIWDKRNDWGEIFGK